MRTLVLFLLATLALSAISQAQPVYHAHAHAHSHKREEKQHRDRPQRLVAREAPAIEKVSNYKAITKWENKKNIALGVVGALAALVTVGVVGLRYTEHAACKAVAKQQQIMQKAWDEAHSDGFVAAGDTMRPADFDCSQQERKFRPLKSYGNAAEWY